MTEINRGTPRNVSLVDYCDFVLSLADICCREKWRKDRHCWYLYRQSFYGLFDYLGPLARVIASEAALVEFEKKGLNCDMRDMGWGDQPRFDNGRAKGTFHLEHVYTGHMFRQDVEKLLHETDRARSLAEIVKQKYCVAWILKSEDKKLGRGDRGDSLESAFAYYRRCGVSLAERSRVNDALELAKVHQKGSGPA
ncbi:hypothetical protein [Jannaschia donghaensis]|uniref:Uncharacterized protein n=1 Tax=Jannaschia donghaensis TaxID=420998 RepID=A0A0M6YF83_9RHOB|nr:hypothetical protein [Jannaschia donghaensis]CTQ49021.1 hypothetical protein JDO7802_01029 [Jannaschia donghaensis]